YAIATDGSGNAYVTGYTTSIDFPTQSPLQGSPGGQGDVIVVKLNSTGGLVYSTYFGRMFSDQAQGNALDGSQNIWIVGSTSSPNLPLAGALQGSYGGSLSDGFVSKLSSDGATLLFSTYLGGNGADAVAAVAVNSTGDAYVTGYTSASNFP